MANSHEQKAPGLVGVLGGALGSLVLGVLLAVVYLILKPVEIVRSAPKDPAPGVRYFVQGGGAAPSGKGWERKQEMLVSGVGEVRLLSGDLNAWAQAASPADPKVEEAKKEARFLHVRGTPNFRIVGEELQVGVVSELICFGYVRQLVFQAQGGFELDGATWRYAPKEMYFGCFPLHRFPLLRSSLTARLQVEGNLPTVAGVMLRRAAGLSIKAEELVVRLR